MADFAEGFLRLLPPEDFANLADHVRAHIDAFGTGGVDEFGFGLDLILDGLKGRNRT